MRPTHVTVPRRQLVILFVLFLVLLTTLWYHLSRPQRLSEQVARLEQITETMQLRTFALFVGLRSLECQTELPIDRWAEMVMRAVPLKESSLPIREYLTPTRIALGTTWQGNGGPEYVVVATFDRQPEQQAHAVPTCMFVHYEQTAEAGIYRRTMVGRGESDVSLGARDRWEKVPTDTGEQSEPTATPQRPGSMNGPGHGLSMQ